MRLYAFGSNGSGQLGTATLDDSNQPQACQVASSDSLLRDLQLPPDESPIRIITGGNHSFIHCKSGAIFQTGNSSSWFSGTVERLSPQPCFELLDSALVGNVKLCSSTWAAAILVDTQNVVRTVGHGPKGELGLGSETTHSTILRTVEILPHEINIVDLASSISHTVLVAADGGVYGWGNGRKGQLGEPAEIVWRPRQISNVGFKVVRVVCGKDFTFLAGDASMGQYMIVGSSRTIGHDLTSNAPEDIQGWIDIGANWGSMHVLKIDGTILSWGRNNRGQHAPPGLPPIKALAVGSEHVIALTSEDAVLAWGWGEHGNCGESVDQDGDVKGRWTSIQIPGIAIPGDTTHVAGIGVGAGCATSFFWTV